MAQSAHLGFVNGVMWKSAFRYVLGDTACENSYVLLMDSEWTLQAIKNSKTSSISIYLYKPSEDRLRKPFRVTTFVRAVGNDSLCLPSCDRTVTTANHLIWTYSGIDDESKEYEILCLFHGMPPGSIQINDKRMTVLALCSLQSSPALEASTSLESLSADFDSMLQDETSHDVVLKCGNRTMSAHKAVLSARSEVFAAMFRNKMVESETGIVEIDDLDPEVLKLFLKYVYSGKGSEWSEDTASSMYSTGDRYAVRALQEECSQWIYRNLTKENCLRFLALAETHSDGDFKERLISFIVNNVQVLDSEAWSSFTMEHPKLAISVYHRCFTEKLFNIASQLK